MALSDNLSIGINHTVTDGKDAGVANPSKEKINVVALGYNLGAVSVVAQYADVNDAGGTTGSDGEQFGLRLSTKF